MSTKPDISVVICTYNRDRYIRQSLECLIKQNLPQSQYEIIVVDNNSTDETARIVQSFISAHPQYAISYVFEAQKGLSYARNRGLQEANSNIIAYIDDDAEAVPHYLDSLLHFYKEHPAVAGVGGKVVPVYTESGEPAWMNKYLNGFVGKVDHGEQPLPYSDQMKYPAGCNMSYRKEILLKAGGFNNELTFRSDDKYIYYKIKELHVPVYYLPQAQVYHHIDDHRLTFTNFKKLFLKTGNEEKVRLRSEGTIIGLIKKGVELGIKAGASLFIYILFLLKGQEIKGRYVVYAQWFTLKGFLMKQVFVR